VINGLTPDALVVFGGSKGTLAEAAFALAARKPLFFCHLPSDQVSGRLLRNFHKYFATSAGNRTDLETYLVKPLEAFQEEWNPMPSIARLTNALVDFLNVGSNPTGTAREVVKRCIAAVGDVNLLDKTGFPGLPVDPTARDRFEEIVRRISRPNAE
jgi:hypothetical protein